MTTLAEQRESRSRLLSVLFVGLATVLVCNPLHAATNNAHEARFTKALELFDKAESPDGYRAAANELESIVADGVENGAVYYNLGNAWYRAGEFGRAILNYRKARPYRPGDAYLASNLQQALAAAPGRLPEPPASLWTHVIFWSDWMSFPTKARLSATSLLLAPLLLIGAALRRSRRWMLAMLIVGLVGSALMLDAVSTDPARSQRAVITGETIARKGTGKDHEPAFDQPLRDGAEFTVLSETGDWTFGHFEGIGDGWVRNEFVAR